MKPSRHRLILTVAVIGVIAAAVIAISVSGMTRPVASDPPAIAPTFTEDSPSAVPSASAPAVLPGLVHTNDPLAYARSVARALFEWDTQSGFVPADYQSVISEDADPSGIETSGLVNDLAAYFPTDAQWQFLLQYSTAETVTISRAWIPAGWAPTVASDPSAVRPGTTAVTIDAIRHRSGFWDGSPVTTANPVSFTVFIACEPTFARCQVLRLSGVNTPLR